MIRTSIVLVWLLLADVRCDAFAVRFGILPAFPVSSLGAGADRERRLDIPVMAWR